MATKNEKWNEPDVNKITVYIGKTILTMILLTILLFVGLDLIFSWVGELRYVGTGHYTIGRAAWFILLSLPESIAEIFPMAGLVGTLLGLGLLASRSELIVMRSAGLSIKDIIIAVLKVALFLVVIAWLLGECAAPALDKLAHRHKAIALSDGQALHTAHGTWMREGEQFIHIQSMQNSQHLLGVTRYQFDKNMALQKMSFAREAKYEDNHWIMYDIKETQFEGEVTIKKRMPSEAWPSHIEPSIINVLNVKDMDELSLKGLWKTMRYRQENALDAKPYELAFWQKIVRPFATLVMMFLAIPFIFGPLRSSTMGLRMLVGVFVGFGFYTINQLFGPLTLVYPLPSILGAWLPLFVFFGMGLFLLRRVP